MATEVVGCALAYCGSPIGESSTAIARMIRRITGLLISRPPRFGEQPIQPHCTPQRRGCKSRHKAAVFVRNLRNSAKKLCHADQGVTFVVRYDRKLTPKTAHRLSRRIRLWADFRQPACAASRRWLQRLEHHFNRVKDRERCHLGAGCSRSIDCPRPAARPGPAGR